MYPYAPKFEDFKLDLASIEVDFDYNTVAFNLENEHDSEVYVAVSIDIDRTEHMTPHNNTSDPQNEGEVDTGKWEILPMKRNWSNVYIGEKIDGSEHIGLSDGEKIELNEDDIVKLNQWLLDNEDNFRY